MTVGRTRCVTLLGIDGRVVDVEADVASGLSTFTVTGLPDTALAQARDRVKAACRNSGLGFPDGRVTVNLSPASLPKHGSGFDLAIAVAVLTAGRVVPAAPPRAVVHLGELGLDGRLRSVRGVLPAVLAAARAGVETVVVPAANEVEASVVPGIDVRGVVSLAGLVALYRGEPELDEPVVHDARPARRSHGLAHRLPAAGRSGPVGRHRPAGRAAQRSRSPLPVATTSSSWGRRARARRCWPHGCPTCCPDLRASSRRWR